MTHMADGSGQRERGIAAQQERRRMASEQLARGRQRLSWWAIRELQRRLRDNPDDIETADLLKAAKLDTADNPKTLTLAGDPTRPLIIGLEPARDSLSRAEEARAALPSPAPDLSAKGRLVPQRIPLASLAKPEGSGSDP